jgi:hypothetical protein
MAEMGAGEARKAGAIEFEGVTPILKVGRLAASLESYVEVLGFKERPTLAQPARMGHSRRKKQAILVKRR